MEHGTKQPGEEARARGRRHCAGSGLWRVGEVGGDDSLSEEAEDIRADWRLTVLWKSLLLRRTTREKSRSWKWLKEGGESRQVTPEGTSAWRGAARRPHSLQRCWRLGFVGADDEEREEDGEQAPARREHRKEA